MNRLILSLLFITAFSAQAQVECDKTTVDYWMAQAEEIISLKDHKRVNTNKNLLRLEEAIALNARITKAYAGLYQREREVAPSRAKSYLWLPGAAFASFEVGQVIRHAYKGLLSSEKLASSFNPDVYAFNPLPEVFSGNTNFTAEQTALTLIKGNVAVYRDLYWQHLVTSQCGVSTVIRVLKKKFYETARTGEMNRWARLKYGWEKIEEGDSDTGNIALTQVEQEIVLQPEIYDGVVAKIGGKVFAKLAKTPLHSSQFIFPTFLEYCDQYGLSKNFSEFNSRWPWIVDQMREMGRFFSGYPEELLFHHAFMVADSKRVIR